MILSVKKNGCRNVSSPGMNIFFAGQGRTKDRRLCRDVACYVAQARAPIDAETCPPLAGWAKRPFVDEN